MCTEAGRIGGEWGLVVRNVTEAWNYAEKREEAIQQTFRSSERRRSRLRRAQPSLGNTRGVVRGMHYQTTSGALTRYEHAKFPPGTRVRTALRYVRGRTPRQQNIAPRDSISNIKKNPRELSYCGDHTMYLVMK